MPLQSHLPVRFLDRIVVHVPINSKYFVQALRDTFLAILAHYRGGFGSRFTRYLKDAELCVPWP